MKRRKEEGRLKKGRLSFLHVICLFIFILY